jgi:MGT family glycosyltransferase
MEQSYRIADVSSVASIPPGTRVLFANVPADGHFNPLTGLAVHLQNIGCDVRWYSSVQFANKIKKLQIPFYPYKKAIDWSGDKLDQHFPERNKIKNQISKLKFDMINAFILRAPEYYSDLSEIYASFPFDILVADITFSAIPFVKDKMGIPVIAIGVLPLVETSKDLAPAGLGMMPSDSYWGRKKQDLLRFLADKVLFRGPNKVMKNMLKEYGIEGGDHSVFDILIRKSNLVLQSGTPGFEYKRSDLGKNIRFIGALLPWCSSKKQPTWSHEKLKQYRKIIVVTQGTVEKDVEKIIVPTLEAFKESDYLVIATTGGSRTAELQARYPQSNFIIEDFIPFDDIMPYASTYITNGGYGGVMLGIENHLPLIVGGVHEGKNEINARVGYFKLGINLGTEKPTPAQIKSGVEKILADKSYKKNVQALSKEFRKYNPQQLFAGYIADILHKSSSGATHRNHLQYQN